MARNEIDVIDVAGLVAYPVFLGIVLGIFGFSINLMSGYDLSQILYSGAGVEVTPAAVAALAAGAWVITTNEIDGSNYEDYEYGAIVGSLAFPGLYMLLEPARALVGTSEFVALALWVAGSAVTVYVAYAE
ncbi:hypothetical protein [Halostella pelagica]|uniref:hypothetical protein n=1 Tax=Halostella pelagica TaxID=2583824 RepID=UPI0010813DC5|nr:hypothetical protein [Halostella pelagica]